MTAWPSLPCPLLSGYQETLPDNTVRTQMDAGPDKVRRISTSNTGTLAFSLLLSKAQLSTLLTFYKTDTSGGVAAFDYVDSRTETTLSCRFIAPPTFNPIGGGRFSARVSLEILP